MSLSDWYSGGSSVAGSPKASLSGVPYEKSKIITQNKKKYLIIDKRVKKFKHIRFEGSDFRKRQIIIKKGDLIKSSDILVLKTLGISKIKVKKKVKVIEVGYFCKPRKYGVSKTSTNYFVLLKLSLPYIKAALSRPK